MYKVLFRNWSASLNPMRVKKSQQISKSRHSSLANLCQISKINNLFIFINMYIETNSPYFSIIKLLERLKSNITQQTISLNEPNRFYQQLQNELQILYLCFEGFKEIVYQKDDQVFQVADHIFKAQKSLTINLLKYIHLI